MEFVEIKLDGVIADVGAQPFRLRFAMTVEDNTDRGWWIDDIQLEREGRQKYESYPFFDPAEDVTDPDNWLLSGTWGRVEGGHNPPAGSNGFRIYRFTRWQLLQ